MSPVLSEIQLVLLAAAALLLLAVLLLTPIAYAVERGTRSWSPAGRHQALLWACLAPILLGMTALLSALSPFWIGVDHCTTHDDGHAHLCFTHLPERAASGLAWLLLAVAGAWLAAWAAEGLAALASARRILRPLLGSATRDLRGAWIVPSRRPFCVAAGLFRVRILVSEGFLNAAPPGHVRAALLHEEAHARRKDVLARLLGRAGAVFYPPKLREALLCELDVAAERACDEAAATAHGDRVEVAEAILSVERLLAREESALAPSLARAVGSVAIARRIESLLEPASTGGRARTVSGGLAALLLVVLAHGEAIHHATESFLATVLDGLR